MGRLRNGTALQLEAMADEIIFGYQATASASERQEIMTPWRIKHRATHEIFTRTGASVDPSTRRGMFRRSYNRVQTHLNSYDGPTRPIKMDSQWNPEDGMPIEQVSPAMAQAIGIDRMDS